MKTRLLLGLIIISALLPVPVQALDYEEYISLEFGFWPTPIFQQMDYGKEYHFDVSLVNNGLDKQEGDVLNDFEPLIKFSGSLILFVSSTFRREGSFKEGDETVQYQHLVHSRDESYEVDFPDVGESNVLRFLREIDYGYDLEDVDLDEWVTLTIDVSLYFKEYAIVGGQKEYRVDKKVSESHMKFYVMSPEKVDYVKAEIDAVEADLVAATKLISTIESDIGMTLSFNLSNYEAQYTTIRSKFDASDNISAMAEADAYNSTWRVELIEVLKQRVEDIQPIERLLEEKEAEITNLNEYYTSQIEDLEVDYGRVQRLYLNSTALYDAEVDNLRADLKTLRANNRTYLLIIVVFLGVFFMMIYRIIHRR